MLPARLSRSLSHGLARVNLSATEDRILKLVPCLVVGSRRSIRDWKQALPYPPNYLADHHLFFPSLKEYLAKKKATEEPVEFVDIGEKELSDESKLSRKQKKELSKTKAALQVTSEDDLLKLASEKVSVEFRSYDDLHRQWMSSKEGRLEFITLAHHYGIFSDLFSSPSHLPYEDSVQKVQQTDFYPRLEEPTEKVVSEWFPGARRVKSREPKKVCYFNPSVAMKIEFAVPEEVVKEEAGKADPDVYEISPVFRGNHIKPKFAQFKPIVSLNVANSEQTSTSTSEGLINLNGDARHYYTLALLNLDSQFGDSNPVCHWLVSNIRYNEQSKTTEFTESIKYLPVYGYRGFGYHRYTFILFRHENVLQFDQVTDYELKKRTFNPMDLVNSKKAVPVGLSWFQTTWDESCQKIFHNILNMKSPVYEWIQPQQTLEQQVMYPRLSAFNVYLDNYRDPKEVNQSVVIERLKEIHPFKYREQMKPSKLPPNIYWYEAPSWMQSTIWKRKNRFGPFRYLRPASAIQPLNNNADLDAPMWPHQSKLKYPLRYPSARKRPKPLKDTRWSLPAEKHPTTFIQHAEHVENNEGEE